MAPGAQLPPVALTIAGSDSGGGAGIQADLKTFSAFGVYGMSVLTAVTAQNTRGVAGVQVIDPEMVRQQLDAVLEDIGCAAAKTGMLANAGVVDVVAAGLRRHKVANLVVDPVMVAKSGDRLLAPDACEVLIRELLPLARVVTPNLHEAEVLTGRTIASEAAMKEAARQIHALGPATVVMKAGHLEDPAGAVDWIYDGERFWPLRGPRIATEHTHGTGCTFSAAIAASLARGDALELALERAKRFITRALAASLPLGSGCGPTNHLVGVDDG